VANFKTNLGQIHSYHTGQKDFKVVACNYPSISHGKSISQKANMPDILSTK